MLYLKALRKTISDFPFHVLRMLNSTFFVKRSTRQFVGRIKQFIRYHSRSPQNTSVLCLPYLTVHHELWERWFPTVQINNFVILLLAHKINFFTERIWHTNWKSTFNTFACFFFCTFFFLHIHVGQWVNKTEQGIGSLQFQHKVLININLTSFVIVNSLLLWDIVNVNFAKQANLLWNTTQLDRNTTSIFCLFLLIR